MSKHLLLLAALGLASTTSIYAQNTFPASGNVGVGTTNPTDRLHVIGRLQIDSDLTDGFLQTKADNSHIRFGRSNGAIGNLVGYRPDVSSGNFVFYTYSGDWIFWNGNVGVGATVPKAKLHVGQSNQEIRFDYNGTDSYYGSLRWAGLQLGNNGENRIVAGRTQPGGLLDFYVNNTNEAADYSQSPNGILAMRISNNGNVGIGTTIPSAKLHIVSGDNAISSILATNSEGPGELRVHSYTTQPSVVPSFGIVHAFYNDERNGFIKFWRGNSACGGFLTLGTGGDERMRLDPAGNVGIGTTSPTEKLSVNGKIRAKEIIVETTGWSDYVFSDSYQLKPLAEVEQHIKTAKHLPGVPSAKEIAANGVSVGDMQAILLAKIEEITLHQIAQEKELAALRAEVTTLKAENTQLKAPTK